MSKMNPQRPPESHFASQLSQIYMSHEGTRASIGTDQPQPRAVQSKPKQPRTAQSSPKQQRTAQSSPFANPISSVQSVSQSVVYFTRGNTRQHWNRTTAAQSRSEQPKAAKSSSEQPKATKNSSKRPICKPYQFRMKGSQK